MFFVLLRLVFL